MREKDIMEAREVAEYLHLHPFTVHKLARETRLPGFKIGNDWRFRRSAIEKWVKLQEKLNHNKNSARHKL
ncbi:MAG: helix-turn-helix domain-containing protein [Candidatus Omnitrophica bacterium]|nr:helix-turn-helix domain-containing protein [Candidatus Omnitrophota bacterium]